MVAIPVTEECETHFAAIGALEDSERGLDSVGTDDRPPRTRRDRRNPTALAGVGVDQQ
jgi:hypothetical protein